MHEHQVSYTSTIKLVSIFPTHHKRFTEVSHTFMSVDSFSWGAAGRPGRGELGPTAGGDSRPSNIREKRWSNEGWVSGVVHALVICVGGRGREEEGGEGI